MWTRHLPLCLALVLSPALVQATSITSFNENGSGKIDVSGPEQAVDTLLFRTGPDPFDPNNGLRPLIYSFPSTSSNPSGGGYARPTNGDLLITQSGTPIDLVRFYNGDIIFYSLQGGNELADVGLPQTIMPNHLDLAASGPVLGYAPEGGQPGYGAGLAIGGNVSSQYAITLSIPEPSGVVLLGIGAVGPLGYTARRRSRTRA